MTSIEWFREGTSIPVTPDLYGPALMTGKRAAAYCRISSDRDGSAAGVHRQEDDCRALIEARGWSLVEVFTDNDISAYSGKARPAYRRMLQAAKNGEFDVLVVWHLDRLTRRIVELEEVIELVEVTGLQVVTVTGGDYDLSTTDGRAMARVVSTFARKESEDKARRNRRKHQEIAEQGLPAGGVRPFGYARDRITVIEDEAELIREAAQRVLAGETLRSIAIDWRQRGIVSTSGNPMDQKRIRTILTRARIAGLRSYRGEVVAKAVWPAIVDEATWQRLQAVLGDHGRVTNEGFRARTHLLTGFLVCGRCGVKLIARRSGKVTADYHRSRTYICTNDPMRRGCGGLRVVAQATEDEVVERLFSVIDAAEVAAQVATGEEREAEAELLAQIRSDEEALEGLARDHYVDRLIGKAEFIAARQGLEQRLAGLRRQLVRQMNRTQASSWQGRSDELRAAWEEMSLDQKRLIVGAYVETITVKPARRGATRFEPERIVVTWRE